MKKTIGIIGAMDIEIEEIKSKMNIDETVKIADMQFLKGTVENTDVILVKCGVGKVYASACTQAMILKFNPDCIINIGVCGCLVSDLKTGDAILGQKVVQYDMDTSAIGDPVGFISGANKIYFDCDKDLVGQLEQILSRNGVNYKKGVVATGDRFVNDSALVKKLRDDFDAVGADMESASIGHVCYINGTPFAILRSMSDSADENSDDDYAISLEDAVKTNAKIIMELCR